jgi:hypothetical protein
MLSRPALKPLDLSELLDTTFSLYRANFALFAGIVAVLSIPQAIISGIVTLNPPSSALTTTTSNGSTSIHVNGLTSYLAGSSSTSLLGLLFSTLITGALAIAVSKRYLGEQVTVGQAYKAVGVVTLFILTVIFVVRWVFVPQAIVLENQGVWGSLRRSWNLVSGTFWRVLGIGIVFVLIVGVFQLIVGRVAGTIVLTGSANPTRALVIAIQAVAGILVRPIELVGITLLYYDLRIRKEGFDLEVMARGLDSGQPA